MEKNSFKYLGCGLGLRSSHYQEIIDTKPALDWFECMTEDYLDFDSYAFHMLEKVREHYPLVMHGVSLSIGSLDPLNKEYLMRVKSLALRIEAAWISDHLCWTGIQGVNLHDLLPVPYTEAMLDHLADRILQVQEYLNQPLVLENPSTYLSFKQDEMPEWEFLSKLVKRTGCRLLLDVNNVFVSSFNHGFDPQVYLKAIPRGSVQQFHLAGHKNFGTHIIDTHDEDIIDPVWGLYADCLHYFGQVSTLIERDGNIPPLKTLLQEVEQARAIAEEILSDQRSDESVC